jgi:hypothetical protein
MNHAPKKKPNPVPTRIDTDLIINHGCLIICVCSDLNTGPLTVPARSTTHYRRRYFGPPVFTQSVFCLRKQIIRAIFYRYCFINSKHPYVVPLTIYNKYNSGSQNICV